MKSLGKIKMKVSMRDNDSCGGKGRVARDLGHSQVMYSGFKVSAGLDKIVCCWGGICGIIID